MESIYQEIGRGMAGTPMGTILMSLETPNMEGLVQAWLDGARRLGGATARLALRMENRIAQTPIYRQLETLAVHAARAAHNGYQRLC